MIYVTGASGELGGAVVRSLTASRVPFLAATRRPRPGSGYRTCDFDRPETLDLTGAGTVVMISAGYAEDDEVVARHEALISAAERDGVRHIVYTSLVSSGDLLSIALPHRWTEERLRGSGLTWTILRNGLYAELMARILTPVDGVIGAPLGNGGVAAVARQDLAEVTARIAVDPQAHEGRIYDLTGPRTITAGEIATLLGAVYRPASLGELRRGLADLPGLRPFEPERMLSICAAIACGRLDGVDPALGHLLGHPARDPLVVVADELAETVRRG
ncbi:MAG: hypothetical protein QG622_1658 [Actinomycetota bacterium]|nr:hypothetical protein [Actinomycetota bacterium]